MKPSDPLLLADDTLCCGMYPAGKVAISRHLATPGSPNKSTYYSSTNIFLQWLMHFLSCCGLVQLGFLFFAQSRSKLTLIEADGSVN